MGNRKCLTHAKSRRAGWLGLIVAVVATSVALGGTAAMAKDAGPRAGTGTFAGIYVWGHGAGKCGRVESSTVLRYYCDDIQRNFAGSFVLIRFPSHEFKAVVELAKGQDLRRGVAWTEQDPAPVPYVYKRGVIEGSQTVTLHGALVRSKAWDLDLDAYPFRSPGPRIVNAEITITRR